MKKFTTEDILKELDDINDYKFFLDLEHGYFYTAGSRINLFADEQNWAIVFEKFGYNNRTRRAEIELNYFGNCLKNLKTIGVNNEFICNSTTITLISGDSFKNVEHDFELISKDVNNIKIRDEFVEVEQNSQKYSDLEINIRDWDNPDGHIDFISFTRYLDHTNHGVCRAKGNELRRHLIDNIPMLISIDKWHHKTFTESDGTPSSV